MSQPRPDTLLWASTLVRSLTARLCDELGQEDFVPVLLAHHGRVEQGCDFIHVSEIFCRTTNQTGQNLMGFPAGYFITFDDLKYTV